MNHVLHRYPFESCFLSYTLCFGCLSILGTDPIYFNHYILFHYMDNTYFVNPPVDGYFNHLHFYDREEFHYKPSFR